MSTLVYAALTTKREEAQPGTSKSSSPPGLQSYIDATAALVPAEVLTLHGLMLSATTAIQNGNPSKTTITDAHTLGLAFYGLIAMSIGFYVVPRLSKWDNFDYLRCLIPPISFVAWTMLQRTTAFDAVAPMVTASARSVIALFTASLVAYLAAFLAGVADKKQPGK